MPCVAATCLRRRRQRRLRSAGRDRRSWCAAPPSSGRRSRPRRPAGTGSARARRPASATRRRSPWSCARRPARPAGPRSSTGPCPGRGPGRRAPPWRRGPGLWAGHRTARPPDRTASCPARRCRSAPCRARERPGRGTRAASRRSPAAAWAGGPGCAAVLSGPATRRHTSLRPGASVTDFVVANDGRCRFSSSRRNGIIALVRRWSRRSRSASSYAAVTRRRQQDEAGCGHREVGQRAGQPLDAPATTAGPASQSKNPRSRSCAARASGSATASRPIRNGSRNAAPRGRAGGRGGGASPRDRARRGRSRRP